MRCKVGDLAIVIRAIWPCEDILGVIVKVEARGSESGWWWCSTSHPQPCCASPWSEAIHLATRFQAHDSTLRPLPGDVTDHDEREPARVPAGERA